MDKIRLLLVDDDAVIRDGLQRILDGAGYPTTAFASGQLAIESLQKTPYDLVITDLKMPGMNGLEVIRNVKILQPDLPILVITGYSTVDTAVEAMKGGAADYISKPFSPEEICRKIRSALEHRAILVDDIYLSKELRDNKGFDRFVGHSRAMEKVYRRILQVAPTESNILATGESGTGKELLARAIHNHSPRKGQPFVAVDCTSLAESLLESELFGHIRGSFTGATQTKTGLFKVADGGTLFLDEVANLSLTTQAKLLRVLQEREVTPIGGTRPIPIDIRLIAATNRNLKEMLLEGTFREDLYFRLNIIPIDLPPLRERDGDLHVLIGHFLKTFSEELGKEIRGLTPNAMALLESYPFPGNVRELENVIERATVLTSGEFIRHEDLELAVEGNVLDGESNGYIPKSANELKEKKRLLREQAVKPIEKAFVLQALERNAWNVTRAAEETGMLRPNFQALIKKFGISIRSHVLD